ncbi:MAG TPA: hypothetical protein VH157_11205 [Bryobacteraceae bacterium]|nr:hypothetical protein [Bryobacteraceae bacterium]
MHKKPTDQYPEIPQPEVQQPIVQPIIDEMKKPHQVPPPTEKAPPVGPIHPPKSAELDQDPGGGYNANHVIPQP